MGERAVANGPSPLQGRDRDVGLRAGIALDLGTAAAAFPLGRLVIPVVVLAIGLGFGLLRPGYVTVYSESLLFIVVAIAVGAFGRTTGALLVIAHGAADMARFLQNQDHTTGAAVNRDTIVGRVVIEGVLWLVVVMVPSIARRAEWIVEDRAGTSLPGRTVGAVAAAAVAGLGTYLWSEVMPYLMRAAYIYSPPPVTLQPQLHPEQLAVAAAVAVLLVTLVVRRRAVAPAEVGPFVAGLPSTGPGGLILRVLGYAALILLVSGILAGPGDALILAAGFVLGEVGAALADRAGSAVARIPAALISAVGLLLAIAVALGLARIITAPPSNVVSASIFLPIVAAAAGAFAVARTTTALARHGSRGAVRVAPAAGALGLLGGVLAVALLLAFVFPTVALADNCSNLGDCGFSQRFLLVISGFAAFFGAGAGAMSGGGGQGGDGGGGGGGGGRGGSRSPKTPPPPPPPPQNDEY